ncbi:hypothetical protein [Mycoplasma hafezii]|uniref:hypothetical protein n=1 Tax=Mycoplasma hafezii TaxID=525886 RepID=UPI003CECE850
MHNKIWTVEWFEIAFQSEKPELIKTALNNNEVYKETKKFESLLQLTFPSSFLIGASKTKYKKHENIERVTISEIEESYDLFSESQWITKFRELLFSSIRFNAKYHFLFCILLNILFWSSLLLGLKTFTLFGYTYDVNDDFSLYLFLVLLISFTAIWFAFVYELWARSGLFYKKKLFEPKWTYLNADTIRMELLANYLANPNLDNFILYQDITQMALPEPENAEKFKKNISEKDEASFRSYEWHNLINQVPTLSWNKLKQIDLKTFKELFKNAFSSCYWFYIIGIIIGLICCCYKPWFNNWLYYVLFMILIVIVFCLFLFKYFKYQKALNKNKLTWLYVLSDLNNLETNIDLKVKQNDIDKLMKSFSIKMRTRTFLWICKIILSGFCLGIAVGLAICLIDFGWADADNKFGYALLGISLKTYWPYLLATLFVLIILFILTAMWAVNSTPHYEETYKLKRISKSKLKIINLVKVLINHLENEQ